MLHEIACHPYAGARLIFSVLFHLQYMCCRSGALKVKFLRNYYYTNNAIIESSRVRHPDPDLWNLPSSFQC